MHNNINLPHGTETQIPCKPLVSIMGEVMRLAHLGTAHSLLNAQDILFEGFLLSETADNPDNREHAAYYFYLMRNLLRTIANLDAKEIRKLNEFLLEICNQQLQKKYYRNIDEFISLEGETIDPASLWLQIDENTLQLEDEDTFVTAFLDEKVFKKVDL